MHVISNTYQPDKANLANSGNVLRSFAFDGASEFSSIMKTFTINQEHHCLKEGRELSSTQRENSARPLESSRPRDFRSKSSEPSSKSTAPERPDDGTSVDKHQKEETRGFSDDYEPVQRTEGKADESAEYALSEDENTASCESQEELLDDEANVKVSKVASDNEALMSVLSTLESGLEKNNLSTEDLKSLRTSIKELAAFMDENGSYLNYSKSMSSLSQSDPALDKFVKNSLSALLNPEQKNLMPQSGAQAGQSMELPADLKAMLSDLNATIKTSLSKNETLNTDFGAKDFSVIEDSIKMSLTLDERLKSLDVKSKIDSIMDGREENSENILEKSLALLKKTAQGQVNPQNRALSERAMLASQSERSAAQPQNLQMDQMVSTLKASLSDAGGKHSGSTGEGQSNSQPQQFASQAMELNKLKHSAESKAVNKTFDLLSLSQNLKENAEALSKKVMEMSSRNLKVLNLNLNPEGLGRMKISIDATSADEITKISISASKSGTRALIEGSLGSLREILASNDITASTELKDYTEEHYEGQEQEAHHQHQEQHREPQQQEDDGIIFARASVDEDVSENRPEDDSENINNSQNGNSVSYFA